MEKSEIPTPALVVDMDAMEANLQHMADFFAVGPCRLRPHYKNHKCVALARRQLAHGAVGITWSSVATGPVTGDADRLRVALVLRPDVERLAATRALDLDALVQGHR